jgi:sphingolipid delta-4 desaturase
LAFKSKRANRYFALLINLPLGIPVAMSFEKYHHPHHRFLGDLKKDVDIPFESEAKAFNSVKGKLFWLLIQPITYGIRPLIKWPQKASSWEIANIVCQLVFDILIVCLFGWKCLAFLVLSTLIGMSLHPLATHFIAEHYVVHEQQETYSYYGPLNYVTFNFGHHVEHHDFPGIPWSRLSQLRKIAPEYYNDLYIHNSWIGFTMEFIFSKKINLFSRITR